MAKNKDICLSLASFVLITFMALPSLMKLSHAIHEHQNQQCSSDIAVHIHNAEFDCDFQKFKLSKQYYTDLQNLNFYVPDEIRGNVASSYNYLSSFQQLHFSLRGPPTHTQTS